MPPDSQQRAGYLSAVEIHDRPSQQNASWSGGCFFFISVVDNTQPLAYPVLTMKTKSDKVFAEVLKQDRTLERFTAAEIAHYLLKQAGGKLAPAIERARNPYRIAGKAVW